MEDGWLAGAKRLQALASTGLHYTKDRYDRERFAEIAAIANTMLASLGSVPVARVEDLISDFANGYATPKVDVRGAVFRRDKILLVQETSDDRWTLPGGFADVGRSPAENVADEVREEAGLHVRPTRLYAVRHMAKHAYKADARDFYKLFFLCDRLDESDPSPGADTRAADYFASDDLPPLSTGRVMEADVLAAFACRSDPDRQAIFD